MHLIINSTFERIVGNHGSRPLFKILPIANTRIIKAIFSRSSIQWIISIISIMPNILRWAISVSLFIACAIPLFDAYAESLGSSVRFAEIADEARKFDFSAVIRIVQKLLGI